MHLLGTSKRSLVLGLAILLAGCHAAPAPEQLNIALAVFPDEAARYDGFVADFESQHHVRVNVLAQTYTDILQAMRVQAASRGSLDLVELDLAMLGEAHDYAQPLDRIVSPSARALFSNEAWNAATIDRHLYFIPHRLMWQAMIYNRVEVPNPPATWDDLARFAREHPGRLALKGARYEGAVCDVMPFVWTAGGSECEPNSPGSIRALDFIRQLAPDLNDESAVFREMSVLEAQARGVGVDSFQLAVRDCVSSVERPGAQRESERTDSGGARWQSDSARRRLPGYSEFRTSCEVGRGIYSVSIDRRHAIEVEPRTRMVWHCAAADGERRRISLRRLYRDASVRASASDGRLLCRSERSMAARDSRRAFR